MSASEWIFPMLFFTNAGDLGNMTSVWLNTTQIYSDYKGLQKKKQLGTPNSNGKTEYDHDLRLSCLKMVIRSSY